MEKARVALRSCVDSSLSNGCGRDVASLAAFRDRLGRFRISMAKVCSRPAFTAIAQWRDVSACPSDGTSPADAASSENEARAAAAHSAEASRSCCTVPGEIAARAPTGLARCILRSNTARCSLADIAFSFASREMGRSPRTLAAASVTGYAPKSWSE
jgi:hypothetical protein